MADFESSMHVLSKRWLRELELFQQSTSRHHRCQLWILRQHVCSKRQMKKILKSNVAGFWSLQKKMLFRGEVHRSCRGSTSKSGTDLKDVRFRCESSRYV